MGQLEPEQKRIRVALIGAAFMTSASSVGPGFMVQTSFFTAQHSQSLAAMVITMIVMDIITELNIWSILGISGPCGQELANRVLSGSGNVIAILVTLSGFTFAIGNVGDAALGLNTVRDPPLQAGYLISCGLAASLFFIKNVPNGTNRVPQVLSVMVLVILLTMAFQAHLPISHVADGLLSPEQPLSLLVPLIMLLGGPTGGYIACTGTRRFPDAETSGRENLRRIQKSTLLTYEITGSSCILIFLVVFGVCATGGQAASSATEAVESPATQAFLLGVGELGSRLSDVALFCADITTIIRSSCTSVSSLKTLYPVVGRNEKWFIIGFIVLAIILTVTVSRTTALLVIAGVINSLVLPLILAITLRSIRDRSIVEEKHRHSRVLTVAGIVITTITTYAVFRVLPSSLIMFY